MHATVLTVLRVLIHLYKKENTQKMKHKTQKNRQQNQNRARGANRTDNHRCVWKGGIV